MSEQRFGNYRVVRKLGEGAMGVVFEAVHDGIGKRAAVKCLHANLSRDPQVSARFLNEARIVNMVQHPGLVSIFEFGRSPDGATYLVMEFLRGETLRDRLERQGKLPLAETQSILRQVADALAAAHEQNIVHRDLKPENLMLVPDPDLQGGQRTKILDFGVAKVAQQSSAVMTQAGAVLGTPAYMAPEQALSAAGVTEKADIYALGIILYEMLAGTAPFLAPSLAAMLLLHLQAEPRPVRELVPEVPEALAKLVARMMAKAPAERPSAREVANAVESLAMPAALLGSSPGIAGGSGAVPALSPVSASLPPAAAAPAAVSSSGSVPVLPQPLLLTPSPTVPQLMLPPPGANATRPLQLPPRTQQPQPQLQGTAFVHRGNPSITVDNWAYIDHPSSNGDPMAQLHLTASWNPGGIGGTYNNHHIGAWYVSNGRWSVYNEDRITLPATAAFNVLVTRAGFIHRALPGNIINNWTLLDHPSTNGRPDALLIITANWNPGGIGGTYNNHALGVWYTEGRWSIYNQDRMPLPVNAAWNVLVSEQTFLHRVAANNLVGVNGTGIEHPAARNPNAIVIVTSNWNPGGLGGLYHDHAIGVYYCQDRWCIFNQDMAPMPIGAAFNILIAG